MIFVDTGAWFALSVESDPDHLVTTRFIAQNNEPLITTDYVVDELLTLFSVRGEKQRGIEWLTDLIDGNLVRLIEISADYFQAACQVYCQFHDKKWSFTDCTSYVVMQHLAISKALSFDAHFRQFGTVQVLP